MADYIRDLRLVKWASTINLRYIDRGHRRSRCQRRPLAEIDFQFHPDFRKRRRSG